VKLVSVSYLLAMMVLPQLRDGLVPGPRPQLLPSHLALQPAINTVVHTPALDGAAVRQAPAHSAAAGLYADGLVHVLDRRLRLKMVEDEVQVHSIGLATDPDLKRLDDLRHSSVFEAQPGQSLDPHEALTRVSVDTHAARSEQLRSTSPASSSDDGLIARVSRRFARRGSTMKRFECPVEPSATSASGSYPLQPALEVAVVACDAVRAFRIAECGFVGVNRAGEIRARQGRLGKPGIFYVGSLKTGIR